MADPLGEVADETADEIQFAKVPIAGDGHVVMGGGPLFLQFTGDKSQGGGDDDLVDATVANGAAEEAVGFGGRVGLARTAGQEHHHLALVLRRHVRVADAVDPIADERVLARYRAVAAHDAARIHVHLERRVLAGGNERIMPAQVLDEARAVERLRFDQLAQVAGANRGAGLGEREAPLVNIGGEQAREVIGSGLAGGRLGMTRARHGEQQAMGGSGFGTGQIEEVDTEPGEHRRIVGTTDTGCVEQRPGKATADRMQGFDQASRVVGQLHGVEQDDDLGVEGGVDQRMVVDEALPGQRQQGATRLAHARIGIIQTWREGVSLPSLPCRDVLGLEGIGPGAARGELATRREGGRIVGHHEGCDGDVRRLVRGQNHPRGECAGCTSIAQADDARVALAREHRAGERSVGHGRGCPHTRLE